MRRVVVLALLALVLPMTAWADDINFTNQYGGVSVSLAGLTTTGSELLSFGSFAASPGHSLGTVSYSTGALISGTVLGGGVFSATGSTFDIIGRGTYLKSLLGYSPHGKFTLFAGSFIGPITWALTSSGLGERETYTLTGEIYGMLYTGRDVYGTTTQTINTYKDEFTDKGTGNIGKGGGSLAVPEPGTLGLLGTGLVGMAGMLRRKMMRS